MASKASSLDGVIDALADAVPESIKHLRAFLVYEGDNPKYYQKAYEHGKHFNHRRTRLYGGRQLG
jgi:hypothetical protein